MRNSGKVTSHRSSSSHKKDKRGERKRTPSLKSREVTEQHAIEKFWSVQETFKGSLNGSKPKLRGACSETTLTELRGSIKSGLKEVKTAYSAYRENATTTPESAIRRAVDLVASEAEEMELRIQQLSGNQQAVDNLCEQHSVQSRTMRPQSVLPPPRNVLQPPQN